MKIAVIAATVLVLMCAPLAIHSCTWYVKANGMGDAPTIQAAIDSAAVGDTVLVV